MTMPPPLAAGCRLAPVGAGKTPGEVGCTHSPASRGVGLLVGLAFSSPEDEVQRRSSPALTCPLTFHFKVSVVVISGSLGHGCRLLALSDT